MKLNKLSLLVLGFGVLACAKQSGVNLDGTCNQASIDAYNAVLKDSRTFTDDDDFYKSKKLKGTLTVEDVKAECASVKKLKVSTESFLTKFGSTIHCDATSNSEGATLDGSVIKTLDTDLKDAIVECNKLN